MKGKDYNILLFLPFISSHALTFGPSRPLGPKTMPRPFYIPFQEGKRNDG